MRCAPAIVLAMLLAGCGARDDQGPVVVSAIGAAPEITDPTRGQIAEPSRLLLNAVAQGLVQFDAAGQVEPGVAERWIVIDDGMSIIFRLGDARWADGSAVTAGQIVTRLRAAVAAGSRNALAPYLQAVGEIVVMTPEVIEVRLRSPRPELLKLFAQPELALFKPGELIGTGPFRVAGREGGVTTLLPVSDGEEPIDPRDTVMLRGERASLAVARFASRRADLVSGGTYADWPLLAQASLPGGATRSEPAAGLFGLVVSEPTGLLASAEARGAIAMAIDRTRLVAQLGDGWQATETVLPEQLESARAPIAPGWAGLDDEARVAEAARRIAAARAELGDGADARPLRVALPAGPGSIVLFAYLAADLSRIGVALQRVGMREDADLRLVDRIAPHDNARWYLAEACRPCGEIAQFAIAAAREASTAAERAARIAEADAALAADGAFIPIARPVRWSLVSARLPGWTANPRAIHPLNRLRRGSN